MGTPIAWFCETEENFCDFYFRRVCLEMLQFFMTSILNVYKLKYINTAATNIINYLINNHLEHCTISSCHNEKLIFWTKPWSPYFPHEVTMNALGLGVSSLYTRHASAIQKRWLVNDNVQWRSADGRFRPMRFKRAGYSNARLTEVPRKIKQNLVKYLISRKNVQSST